MKLTQLQKNLMKLKNLFWALTHPKQFMKLWRFEHKVNKSEDI